MFFDLPVEVPAEVRSAVSDAESAQAIVDAGLAVSTAAIDALLGSASPFDAATTLNHEELTGQDAAPTWGSSCGNSTYGHTCCWHCY